MFSMTITSALVVVVCAVVCIGYVDASCCTAPLPSSCEEHGPICQSGYFLITTGQGDITNVYCSTEELCGSTGWTGVGIADFGNPQTPCPDGLIEYKKGELRACKRKSPSSTNSVIISTNGISYSQVCGKVLGYPHKSLDAFNPKWTGKKNIEKDYVDGISITHGAAGSRQHIFSLAGAGGQGQVCPCSDASKFADTVPEFVGEDYYCESGGSGTDDILWDGKQCDGNESPCCTSPLLPYFHKKLESPTTDDIELRILPNQNFNDEDLFLLSYEIFVK